MLKFILLPTRLKLYAITCLGAALFIVMPLVHALVFQAIEVESGMLGGDVALYPDGQASGGAAVKFSGMIANGTVTHGDQLTENNVGPWALQGVPKGQEQLDAPSRPSRGYWRLDTPAEFMPTGTYTYNNNPSNKGGTLAADTLIDGYLVPAGTRVVQFRDLSATDFYAGGATGSYLFRGIRSRQKLSGAGFFNDSQAGNYTMNLHYSDVGSPGPADSQSSEVAIKFLGGKDHRILRSYFTYIPTALQPNVAGVEITENYIDKIIFYYGEPGPSGSGGSSTYHLNGISVEGMSNSIPTRFKFLRNRIVMPSPDEAGHITTQTDCIALFQSNSGSYNDVLVQDNYLGGAGYTVYAGANPAPTAANDPKSVRFIGNTFTTKWWTDSGNHGAIAAQPNWGSNGNVATGNVWADDYGSGGNGNTPTSARQYPSGNGPRKGQTIFGN